MRFPRTKTHPTELHLARRVLARHVIAAAILLNRHLALRTLFRVRRDPVRRLAVVAALFRPQLEKAAIDGFMPLMAAREAETMR